MGAEPAESYKTSLGKNLIPWHWCGVGREVEQGRVFVCGACSDPQACADADACRRHVEGAGNCGCSPGCGICEGGERA